MVGIVGKLTMGPWRNMASFPEDREYACKTVSRSSWRQGLTKWSKDIRGPEPGKFRRSAASTAYRAVSCICVSGLSAADVFQGCQLHVPVSFPALKYSFFCFSHSYGWKGNKERRCPMAIVQESWYTTPALIIPDVGRASRYG